MPRPVTNQLAEIEIDEQIRQLKAAGASYRAIAAQLDLSHSKVQRRYKAMVNASAAEHAGNVAEHREELGDHYQLILKTMLSEMVTYRGTGHAVNAANSALRALRQMVDLYGLAVPAIAKILGDVREVDDAEVLVGQIERWLHEATEEKK